MTNSTFDSIAAMRALEAVGVDRNQAEAHAEQLRAAAGAGLGQLANKEDLARVEATLTAQVRIVKRAMALHGAISLVTLAAVLGPCLETAAVTAADIERLADRIDSLRSELWWGFGFLAALLLALAAKVFGIVHDVRVG